MLYVIIVTLTNSAENGWDATIKYRQKDKGRMCTINHNAACPRRFLNVSECLIYQSDGSWARVVIWSEVTRGKWPHRGGVNTVDGSEVAQVYRKLSLNDGNFLWNSGLIGDCIPFPWRSMFSADLFTSFYHRKSPRQCKRWFGTLSPLISRHSVFRSYAIGLTTRMNSLLWNLQFSLRVLCLAFVYDRTHNRDTEWKVDSLIRPNINQKE
jgi:hypothetical protein